MCVDHVSVEGKETARGALQHSVVRGGVALCVALALPWNVRAGEDPATVAAQVNVAIALWDWAEYFGAPEHIARRPFEAIKSIGPPAIPPLIHAVEKGTNTRRRLFAIACLSRAFGEDACAAEPTLRKLLDEALRKDDQVLWIGAMQALDNIAPEWAETAVATLQRFLEADDRYVRANAIYCLRHAGPAARAAIPRLIEILKTDESTNCKIHAAEALAVIGPTSDEALAALIETLDGPLPMMAAIARYGPQAKDAVPQLIGLLGHANAGRREEAAMALGAIGPHARAASPTLMNHLETDDCGFVRARCATALVKIDADSQDLMPALIRACQSSDVTAIMGAMEAMQMIGPQAEKAIPQLLRLLDNRRTQAQPNENQKARLTYQAVVTLGYIGAEGETVTPALELRLSDASVTTRVAAAVALSQYGVVTSESLGILDEALNDKHSRYSALPALNAIDGVALRRVPHFLAKIEHEDKFERLFALSALAEYRTPNEEMLSAISRCLKDRHGFVRVQAARALGRMGPLAKSQVGALHEAARTDRHWVLRQAAQEALDKIASESVDE